MGKITSELLDSTDNDDQSQPFSRTLKKGIETEGAMSP